MALLVILEDLGDLEAAERVVAAALDVGVVDHDAGGPRLQGDAPSAPRLRGIDRPAEAILRSEQEQTGVLDWKAAENRLARDRRHSAAGLADLLKFARARPVEVELVRERPPNIAV